MSTPTSGTPSFEDTWPAVEHIGGWLTRDQGEMLWEATRRLPPGSTVLEIGSHQGRSTVVLATAVEPGGVVIAVDPFVEGRLFGGSATKDLMVRNLASAGIEDRVELVTEYSTELRPRWSRRIDLLYIDGKHDYWTVTDDLKWARFLNTGSKVYVHDSFSSIGVTLGLLANVLPSRNLRYDQRAGSLAEFTVGRPSWADRRRLVGELPWWLRNVLVKVLLRLRLRPVARAFGHDSPYDPY